MGGRDTDRALGSRLGAGCVALLFAAEMVLVARAGHAMPGIPVLAALCAPFALFAVCGVARMQIEDRGIRIVNVCRSLLISWNDVESFSLGRHGLLRKVGIAQLHDGGRVGIWGIQGPNALTRRSTVSAERLVAAMNAELGRRRSAVEPDATQRGAVVFRAPSPRSRLAEVPPAPASDAPAGQPQAA